MNARSVVALAVLLASCGGNESAERLPNALITALGSGETVQLADIEGPAVINLWATRCAPCRAEIPDFEAVHQARGTEIRFVGINIGESDERAQAFIDDIGATYDQFVDSSGDVATGLRATSMPTTVVIDADGLITLRTFGALDRADLGAAIDEATDPG